MVRKNMNSVEQCPKCKNYFTISEIGGQFPGCKESEEIDCPHENCDYSYTRRSNGTFQTHKAKPPKEN